MNRNVVGDMVNHFDKQSVTFPSNNTRSRKLAIHCHNALSMAQTCHILHFNLTIETSKHIS